MSRVNRQDLEQQVSVDGAAAIVDNFLNDRISYPDDAFRLRRGICKVLAEEYLPLVRLAQAVRDVQSLQLLPESNKGPDGQIRFYDQSIWSAQITCGHENYQAALMREQIQHDGMVVGGKRHRDKQGGHIICEPTVFYADTEVEARVERILSAIRAKENNYHPGTDTLIVLEAPARFSYLQERGLHTRIVEALRAVSSDYDRIYVIYGMEVKLAHKA